MKFPHFFIERPIFAAVISILIVLFGLVSYTQLPVAQYPEIAPPTITVTATYPGANADTVAETVATPIEQELNGVEDMLYISSQATDDGKLTITVTFKLGTNLDTAQVLVQNRVAIAEPRLPQEVRQLGIVTAKASPDLLMVVHIYSPDGSRDQLYMSNYALLQLREQLARLDGVGSIQIFGARDYSMRIWLNPSEMSLRQLTVDDVLASLRAQNIQVASGTLNQPPINKPGAYQIAVRTLGRLREPGEFQSIVVKQSTGGRITYLKDIARVELGAQDYSTNAYLDGKNAVAIALTQRPGSNALATAQRVLETMKTSAKRFPSGVAYDVIYNPTEYIAESVHEVYKTIFEAVVLVCIVVIIFLQSWRAAVIPIVAIPVALIGTFGVMAAFGFSLNNLTLFGLVLAVGIVVDDAIVVVENVERRLSEGLSPRESAHATMDEVSGALIAIALVLSAVFIPTAFISGISGQFYKQFALAIAAATIISAFNSLTLSPALAALLLRPHNMEHGDRPSRNPITRFFGAFNRGFEWLSHAYGRTSARLIRLALLALAVYAGLLLLAGWRFSATPTGFIPDQDQSYVIAVASLPPGSALSRTDEVVREIQKIALDTPGFLHTAGFAGFNGATFTNASNSGAVFVTMKPFSERQRAPALIADLQKRLSVIKGAFILVISPPPVRGIGQTGGLRMMVQDRDGAGAEKLNAATQALIARAMQDPLIGASFTFYENSTPQLYLDIDRVKAQQLQVDPSAIFSTLQVFLGSAYVNDFNYLGRTYRVTAEADGDFRRERGDIADLRTRNAAGQMVPLGSLVRYRDITGPTRQPRYNLYGAAELDVVAKPGVSTGQVIKRMEELAAETLPPGFDFEWTGLAYQETTTGNTASIVFALAVFIVFLVLAALYESWVLPLAIVLIVPMCLLSAILGVNLRGLDNNILTQVGLVVLVGLACKNAILIVEFAKQREDEGETPEDAAIDAARLRLRPILMTSFAFVLGVVPLLTAAGAGAEMRQALGTAVFFGMLGVTIFGLFLTPVFYVLCRRLGMRIAGRKEGKAPPPAEHATEAGA